MFQISIAIALIALAENQGGKRRDIWLLQLIALYHSSELAQEPWNSRLQLNITTCTFTWQSLN